MTSDCKPGEKCISVGLLPYKVCYLPKGVPGKLYWPCFHCLVTPIYQTYVTKKYQNVILHIVLRLTAYGQNGPIGAVGVPVVLRVAGAWRKGDGEQETSIWKKPGSATFNHVLHCRVPEKESDNEVSLNT